jgi:hypothetical protein
VFLPAGHAVVDVRARRSIFNRDSTATPTQDHTMNIRTALATGTLAVLSATAFAQAPAPTATPRVDARQANQEKRIEQGVASGQLTSRETLRLEREQKRVAVAEAKAKADGAVTAGERKHLHKLQNAASQDIHHQKHDAQTAAPAPTMK